MEQTKGLLVLQQANAPYGHERYDFYECVDCHTSFPYIVETKVDVELGKIIDQGSIRCNSRTIQLCPWCREDSQPWKYGRGV